MKKIIILIILFILCFSCFTFTVIFSESRQNQNVDSPFGMSGALSRPYIESDKVKHEEVLRGIHEKKEPYKEAQDIGVKWIRPNSDIYWRAVQRRLEDVIAGHFDWESIDDLHGRVPPGIGIFGTIDPLLWGVNKDPAFKPGTWEFVSPQEERNYLRFVREMVERYDGDGYKDMPGLKNPIKYWQIGNEAGLRPLFGIEERYLIKEVINKELDWKGFCHLVEITCKAIKESDPDTKVALAGLASGHPNPDDPLAQLMTVPPNIRERQEFYIPLLQNLHGKYIDIFDIHYYGALQEKGPDSYQWLALKDVYDLIRQKLNENGYQNTEIWFTEIAVPSQPFGEKFQAIHLVKRYIYALSLGVKKIFWWNIIEGEYPLEDPNRPSNHFGLIYDGIGSSDPGYGVKKLAYYSYKKMIEILERSDWGNIKTVQESDGVYIFKFSKNIKPIWVVWNENGEEKQINLNGIKSNKVKITKAVPEYESGKEIKDYSSAFTVEKITVADGKFSFAVADVPFFVEELQ